MQINSLKTDRGKTKLYASYSFCNSVGGERGCWPINLAKLSQTDHLTVKYSGKSRMPLRKWCILFFNRIGKRRALDPPILHESDTHT